MTLVKGAKAPNSAYDRNGEDRPDLAVFDAWKVRVRRANARGDDEALDHVARAAADAIGPRHAPADERASKLRDETDTPTHARRMERARQQRQALLTEMSMYFDDSSDFQEDVPEARPLAELQAEPEGHNIPVFIRDPESSESKDLPAPKAALVLPKKPPQEPKDPLRQLRQEEHSAIGRRHATDVIPGNGAPALDANDDDIHVDRPPLPFRIEPVEDLDTRGPFVRRVTSKPALALVSGLALCAAVFLPDWRSGTDIAVPETNVSVDATPTESATDVADASSTTAPVSTTSEPVAATQPDAATSTVVSVPDHVPEVTTQAAQLVLNPEAEATPTALNRAALVGPAPDVRDIALLASAHSPETSPQWAAPRTALAEAVPNVEKPKVSVAPATSQAVSQAAPQENAVAEPPRSVTPQGVTTERFAAKPAPAGRDNLGIATATGITPMAPGTVRATTGLGTTAGNQTAGITVAPATSAITGPATPHTEPGRALRAADMLTAGSTIGTIRARESIAALRGSPDQPARVPLAEIGASPVTKLAVAASPESSLQGYAMVPTTTTVEMLSASIPNAGVSTVTDRGARKVPARPTSANLGVSLTAYAPETDALAAIYDSSAIIGVVVPNATITLFAPGSVSDAAVGSLRADLVSSGYDLSSPARVNFSISKSNVRYYHAEDAAVAASLAADSGALLRDFTGSGSSAPPGTIELWLAGKPGGGATAAPKPAKKASTNTVRRQARPNNSQKTAALRSQVIQKLKSATSQ
ncbi:hypothetical protein [Tropicimonas marinistellae]|uniref:hypothetical protein n=1 Tax=Tropicimonas marinistellae TaxID=1739787 RepID=UPI0008349875|nr:hypothetical protein [Tropicimonas marinistellae]